MAEYQQAARAAGRYSRSTRAGPRGVSTWCSGRRHAHHTTVRSVVQCVAECAGVVTVRAEVSPYHKHGAALAGCGGAPHTLAVTGVESGGEAVGLHVAAAAESQRSVGGLAR